MTVQVQPSQLIDQLKASQEYFERSSRVLEEGDSEFRPEAGMMTVAQQVAHAAQTLEWFVEGVTSAAGFDLDFEKHAKGLEEVKSLAAAREKMASAFTTALAFVGSRSAEDLNQPMAPGPIMGGRPLSEVVWAMVEHTAHHRGALTVYSRLLGKVPPMPYGG